MKNYIIALALSSIFTTCFSQNHKFQYIGRFTPSIKKEKLKNALFINEIMPEFCRYVSMPSNEIAQLNQLLTLVTPSSENYSYPRNPYFRVRKNYEQIIDYVSIEISTIHQGKTITYSNTSDALTLEQKNSLSNADFGTDIHIKVRFKYKNWANINNTSDRTIKEAIYIVTVVPEIEALYPGGFMQLTAYLTESIIDKISEKNAAKKIQNAIVMFNVNEEGEPVDARLIKSSKDLKTDQLILEAIQKMPKWKPAENPDGTVVKQEIRIPFGGGGC